MKLTLNIETNNAAFTDEEEPTHFHIAEAIDEQLAAHVREGGLAGIIRDPINGSVVGTWELVPGVTE
jgi:hypothetical protein